MNKIIKMISIILLAAVITGCGGRETRKTGEKETVRFVTVTATTFPLYDWVREIMGEEARVAEITLLTENGVDMHSFQPAALDMILIGSSDLFVYVGGESDQWVEEILKDDSVTKDDLVALNLMEALGEDALREELVEGMQEDHEHEHVEDEHDHDEEDHVHANQSSDTALDEHVWLSLKNAQVLTKAIAESLANVNPSNADMYFENQAAYAKKLAALDAEYEEVIKNAQRNTLLFGDRFPFRYLLNDYGVSYYAAFPGCSSETEASFETVSFLANKTKELELNCVLTIEGSDNRIAQTIIDSAERADCKTLTLDSMQSVTKDDIENGVTYLSVMEENLEVLKEALQ